MHTINNLSDLLEIINEFYKLLKGKFDFDSEGWPVFRKEQFLSEWPDDMISYSNRNNKIIVAKNRTLLCYFAGDILNYRRFPKILEDISEYQKYFGVVFPDITVTKDMDIELQEAILLANQLFAAILAVNNVKLAANTRCGSATTRQCFRNIPRNVIWASGFLGCNNLTRPLETAEYVNKILGVMPSKLIIYGKQDLAVNKQLDVLGINYRYYIDFHRRCQKEVI